MITAKSELADLKKKKYTELDKAVQTIKNKYQLAISNQKSLKELLDQSKFQTSQLGEKSIQLEILKRKVETNRFLYDALIKKMKEEGITEQSQSVNVWVIEKARVPEFPATPNKKRNILLGIVLGLFGGIGLAFFLEYLDTTIKTPEDVEEKFNIPVIATVDLFKNKDKTIVEHVFDDPSSMVSENFKSMRTSILLSSPDHPPKTILITSMTSGEGKSSVCACLASAIAQTGKKVLVIDGDMRRPTQHKIFGLDNSAGLSSLLAGMDVSGDALINRKVDATGLIDIITSGPIPPNPSELLSSTMAGTLINKAAGSYDFIIVDTPPLASVTDPLITSRHVDAVIIVTWAGKTNYELIGKGIRQFKDICAPITGVVLNRFSAKKSGYYYNYGDYYYASES
jgi:capsular exopolysaccharide synthesis family protein